MTRLDAMTVHQAGNPVAPHPLALGMQGGMHAGTAGAVATGGMNTTDVIKQSPVGRGAGAFRASPPRVVAAAADRQHRAHHPHEEHLSVVLDETELHLGGPAKIPTAFLGSPGHRVRLACRDELRIRGWGRRRAVSALCSPARNGWSGGNGSSVKQSSAAPVIVPSHVARNRTVSSITLLRGVLTSEASYFIRACAAAPMDTVTADKGTADEAARFAVVLNRDYPPIRAVLRLSAVRPAPVARRTNISRKRQPRCS